MSLPFRSALVAFLILAACSGPPPSAAVVVPDTMGLDLSFGKFDTVTDHGGPADSAPDAEPDAVPPEDGTATVDADAGSDAIGQPAACATPHGAGCACAENADCDVALCIATPDGPRCAQTCVDSCPGGFKCAGVTSASGDVLTVCVPRWGTLCNPCHGSSECQTVGVSGAVCVNRGADGSFCGASCQEGGDCPAGYVCGDSTSSEGKKSSQCVPASGEGGAQGVCGCSVAASESLLTTGCFLEVKDDSGQKLGTCKGSRQCGDAGLTACSAPAAASETCNGEDDDCDGQIDEGACDDGNPCTTDACDATAGACSHVAAPGSCDADANACTVGDACIEGKCMAGKVKNCDDGNPCTVDACNPATGCTSTQDDGAPCNDDDACTLGDVCKAGACQPGVSKVCANNGPCIVTACQSATGQCASSSALEGKPCDDKSACTKGDACASGACTGLVIECDDANPCTLDTCNADKGCTHTASAVPCDDGNACTDADTCQAGSCVGTPKDASKACADGTPCTTDGCDPAAGCVHAANSLACDDGNACTNGDTCKDKQCVSGTSTCACTADADCAKEEDGNLCNGTLFCDKATLPYKCKVNPATVVTCSTSGDTTCAKAGCDPTSGKCAAKAEGDGTGCDADGSVCTVSDACVAGACKPGVTLSCDDSNPCTTDACDTKAGCTHTANASPCDDGNACTVGDGCNAKLCVPGAAKNCSDGQDCTIDGCDVKTGVCGHDGAAKNGQACDADGSICTVGDACADGACQAGPQVSCNDNNACTVDSCSATKGCGHVNAADQTSCGTGLWCIAASCKKKPLCGDNVLDTGEQCDDGNLDSGDGCSAGCLVEKPPVPLPGELLVTEIMVGPNVDDKYEWFELYNVTDKPLMLGGLWYGDGNLGKQFAANKVLNPKSYILLAATASPGGPTPDVVYGYDTGGIALNNSDDWVLICKTGSCANASDVVAGVHYTSGKNGWKTQTKGRSYQLSPSAYDGTKMTDGLNWCLGKSPYGTNADLGTPGKANDTCP